MKILTVFGSYIKTHIITTAVVGTVVVGGAIATPIIVNNINDNQNKVGTEVKEPNKKEEAETKTCDEGYELVDNECIIKQEVQEEPKEDENTNNENTPNTNKPNTNTSTNKPNNNKPNQNNNTTKPQENKPQESKPTCNDISCKVTENNRVVYYEGKMLFGIKVYQPYGYDVDGWQYNSSLIQSLSKEDRNYVFNNYFKKETYCSTAPSTPANCLKYSALEKRLDEIIKTSEDEIYYSKQAQTWPTNCIKYFQEGFIANGYNEDTMKAYCTTEYGNGKYETDLNDFQQMLNKSNSLIKLHTNVINESNSYKTAYQTTRSLLQQ